jgi:hypothetical protein
MIALFPWLRWALFILPYTLCWWVTYVLGWLLYGAARAPRVAQPVVCAASLDAWLRAVPLQRRG